MMNKAVEKKPERLEIVVAQLLMRPEVMIGVVLMAFLHHKIKLMESQAVGAISIAVVQHDAMIFALMLLLYTAGSVAARWNNSSGTARAASMIFSRLCIAAFLLVVLLYVVDVLAYQFFVTRLYASDLVEFSAEPRAVFSLLSVGSRGISQQPAWRLVTFAALLVILLRACYMLLAKPLRSPLRSSFLVAAAVSLAILFFVPVPGYAYHFADRRLYENFIECNHNFFVRRNFSDAFQAQILAAPPPAETCAAGRGRRLNVILLLVESLSAYQSHFFSGIKDWTPRLDEIAGQETALTNFYANGWTTAGGMISLLVHTFPLVPDRRNALFPFAGALLSDYVDVPRPLPRMLVEQGYATEFVAAGGLAFLGQDTWLRSIGFQKLVGGNDPRYDGQKFRGPFNAVPDRLLYGVALEEAARMPAEKPYFMVVQTLWSHRPFIDPNGGGLHGAEPVFREADSQIGAFYDHLMAAGFFKNGLLFIVGDHRAMEPFEKSEFDRFGASAVARIPAIIATRAIDLPRVLTQNFQQRDFSASIESLVSDRYCLGPQEGSFLSDPPIPASCIMHTLGVDRELIFVKCGNAEGTVRAAGDATRFVSGAVPDEASIIQTVNRTRVRPVK
jgi:phosphoglycerol transferase MdoB-like AlkP superfamily enzyme